MADTKRDIPCGTSWSASRWGKTSYVLRAQRTTVRTGPLRTDEKVAPSWCVVAKTSVGGKSRSLTVLCRRTKRQALKVCRKKYGWGRKKVRGE